MDGELKLSEIGQIGIPVKDVAKSVAFYRDALGMKLLFQAPPQLAFFQNGSVRLMLSGPEGTDESRGASVIYYRVASVTGATETLRGRGVKITSEPHLIARMPDHELWMAFFEDPDGNMLAMMEERR